MLEKLYRYVDEIKVQLDLINVLMKEVGEDKMKYPTSRDIRKAAQEIRLSASNIREITSTIFKSSQKNDAKTKTSTK